MLSKGLFGRKYLDIQERSLEIGEPDEDHVVVEVKACGVCGTDINFVRDAEGEYNALGHEISAEVVAVGKNVRTVRRGDHVIVEDCTMCGVCEECKSGHPELCRNLYSLEGQPGMGQYMSVHYNSLVPYQGLDHVSASLTEPLAVALTAVLNAQIPLGGSVVVLGDGPLGLMAASLAKLRGAGFVAITGLPRDNEREKARLDAAEALGCNLAIQVGKESVEEAVKSRFPKGVDRVIVSSPPQSMYDAFKVIRFGGIITFFGLHLGGKNKVELDVNDMIFRKITLIPTFAEPAINFPISNRLLRDGLIDHKILVTHTFGLSEARGAMKGIVDGSLPAIKAVMLPNG
jgi:Threonine dehydrogenase and related Zn-dependent dehydrogenases